MIAAIHAPDGSRTLESGPMWRMTVSSRALHGASVWRNRNLDPLKQQITIWLGWNAPGGALSREPVVQGRLGRRCDLCDAESRVPGTHHGLTRQFGKLSTGGGRYGESRSTTEWRTTVVNRFRSGAVLAALTAALMACGGSTPPDQVLVENRPEEWASAVDAGRDLPNLHKLSDELYRGAQPEEAGFSGLKNLGVRTVVNLRTFHSDRDECRDAGLEYVHIPVQAWDGEDDEVVEFLEVVSNPDNQPVFVHCMHGADRTGVMSAAYRIVVQGWSKEEAIREMTEGGFGFHGVWQNLIDYVEELDVEGIRAELSAPEGDIQDDAVSETSSH